MTKKKKEPEAKKPEWKDESSQSGEGTILYRVLIRQDDQHSAPFAYEGKVITREWQDAGNLLLEKGGVERRPTDYRTLKRHGWLPFVLKDEGLFDYDGAMAFAFWCKANIEGKYRDSRITPRVETALQRIRISHSLKLEAELVIHELPRELELRSFIEQMEGEKA